MTEQHVVEVIVDEARATVERFSKADRRPWPEAAMASMLAEVREVARRNAPTLLYCTEPQIREACSRHIRARLRDLEGDTADHAKRLAEIEALAAIAATSPWTAWRLVRDHLPWLLAEHRAASEALAAAGIPDDGRGLAERVKALAAALGPIVAAIAAAEATPGAGEPW